MVIFPDDFQTAWASVAAKLCTAEILGQVICGASPAAYAARLVGRCRGPGKHALPSCPLCPLPPAWQADSAGDRTKSSACLACLACLPRLLCLACSALPASLVHFGGLPPTVPTDEAAVPF